MHSSPSDPLHGLDPASLMAAAAMPTDGDAETIPLKRADLPSQDEIAAAFPDLEILGLIGHGGMSAVFKARQPKLDRVVALKVLPKSLAATPGFAERFNREGRVLARLSHASIVAVHDFGESGGFAYLIMEFVDGVNLRQAMRAGRFTPDQALKIIPAICDALQFAHTQGVLHRDIKPENILLDTTGRVKIADFGIAKILDEKGGDMLLTQSGAKLGTAPYMAPEQIEQPSSVDHRADIYSLGVVFYEMLTGELPLGRFAAPSTLSSVGGNIDEIVFRALEKERARRQQSVGEFKTQIEGAGAPTSKLNSSRHEQKIWLLAFSIIVPCAVLFWVGHRWQQMLDEHSRFYLIEVPAAVSLIGAVMFLASIPLWLRLVPRNRFYGLRLPSTMLSDDRWYDANAHAGKKLFEWSISLIIAGIAGFYQLPRHQDDYPWAALFFTFAALVCTGVSIWWWLRHHPVDGRVKKESLLAKLSGNLFIALIVAFFVRSFILHPFKIPNGAEAGVNKGSHWIASKLDTGFSTGNLIVYEHESGVPWIARIVEIKEDGFVLKCTNQTDTFFVKWDKVIGKMLFSHYTPYVVKEEPVVKTRAFAGIPESSSKALNDPPVLRFSRLKLNDAEWRWPVYAPDGSKIENAISQPLIRDDFRHEHHGPSADDCWWQLFFQHPDFDTRSVVNVSITHLDGSEIVGRDSSRVGPDIEKPNSLASIWLSPGNRTNLPRAVRMVLRYSIGPWRNGSKVKSTFNGFMGFEDGELTGFGEGLNNRVFISWVKQANDLQSDANVRLIDGQWIRSFGASYSTTNKQIIQKFEFEARLAEVDYFQTRQRPIKTIVFDKVIVPPLPDDENAWVTVSGGTNRPGPLRWTPDLTVQKAIEQAGGISWKAPKKFRLIREGVSTDYSFRLAVTTITKPDDQIIIPE